MRAIDIPEALPRCTYILFTLLPLLRLGLSRIIVTDCGVSKGCFRVPEDCGSMTSCDVIVTWQQAQDEEHLVFELAGNSSGYVAVGFSSNQLMSNTDVLACVDNNGVTVKHFFNTVSHVNEPRTQVGVTNEEGTSRDGVIQCRFTRIKYIAGQQNFMDLRENVYVLLARGQQSNGFPTYHTLGRYVSGSKADFSIYQAPYDLVTESPWNEGNETRSTNQTSVITSGDSEYLSHGPTTPISSQANKRQAWVQPFTMFVVQIAFCVLGKIIDIA